MELDVINNHGGFRGWCMWHLGARLACVDPCLQGAPAPTRVPLSSPPGEADMASLRRRGHNITNSLAIQ